MPLWRSGIMLNVIGKIFKVAPIQRVSFLFPLLTYIVVHFKRVDSSLYEFIRPHLLQHYIQKLKHFLNLPRCSLLWCPLQERLSIFMVSKSEDNQFTSLPYHNIFGVYFQLLTRDQCLLYCLVGLQDTQRYLIISPNDIQLVTLHVPMAALDFEIPAFTILSLFYFFP